VYKLQHRLELPSTNNPTRR